MATLSGLFAIYKKIIKSGKNVKDRYIKKKLRFKNVLTKGKYYNGNYIDIYIKKIIKKLII